MKKHEEKLNYYEMSELWEKNFFRGLYAGLMVPPMIGFNMLFFLLLNLPILGWITVALTLSCTALAVVFNLIAAYWSRKSNESPQWFIETNAKWQETHGG